MVISIISSELKELTKRGTTERDAVLDMDRVAGLGFAPCVLIDSNASKHVAHFCLICPQQRHYSHDVDKTQLIGTNQEAKGDEETEEGGVGREPRRRSRRDYHEGHAEKEDDDEAEGRVGHKRKRKDEKKEHKHKKKDKKSRKEKKKEKKKDKKKRKEKKEKRRKHKDSNKEEAHMTTQHSTHLVLLSMAAELRTHHKP